MRNLLFYKYVELPSPEEVQVTLRSLLESLDMKGTILLATEGINGCITGTDEACLAFREAMKTDSRFADIEYKDTFAPEHSFKKIKVKTKPEIVRSNTRVSVENRAPYIEPQELKELLASENEVILLDARNNYESAIGKFKGAIAPDIDVFSEFTQVAQDLQHLKDKPIVTYCTGGIRCEKASAVLREHGFTNVRQLHGGIIRYGEEVGGEHWEGACFVFDTRRAVSLDGAQLVAKCARCSSETEHYGNCRVFSCDKWFSACDECREAWEECCSENCAVSQERKAPRNDKKPHLVSCSL